MRARLRALDSGSVRAEALALQIALDASRDQIDAARARKSKVQMSL
jgi:hypothetical protein